MRPGQLTPENNELTDARLFNAAGFNEAGAINPGKPWHLYWGNAKTNMASMRPGQLTPENQKGDELMRQLKADASMRPGQLTPENLAAPVRNAVRCAALQ